ncbi:serine protease F56F10.1 [Aphelenchoides avenae]|nr:serine protease F56F10.1 [Aphelenchus avenae]
MCTDLFSDPQTPFTEGDIFAHVEATHKKFGDPNTYNATNVVLPNGAFDPWHALGVNRTIGTQHQTAILTPGKEA